MTSVIWTPSGIYHSIEYSSEADLENVVLQVQHQLFGPSRIYLDVKKKIGRSSGIRNIPDGGLHCVKVILFPPSGYKVYPSTGYSYYHFYAPTTLDFKVKTPNKSGRSFFYARMNWSKDYMCNSIRISKRSSQVEIIVTK